MSRSVSGTGLLLAASILAAPVPAQATTRHNAGTHAHAPAGSGGRSRRATLLKQFPPHAVGDIFGVGSFVTQRSWTISPLVVGRARALGAGWVREEFTASLLHTGTSGRYLWSDYDRIVNQERRAGLQVLGLLDYNNTWAFQDHGDMPHDHMQRLVADFSRYAYSVARHFRGRVRYWEIWNEPNLETFWHPAPDASDYAALVTVAGKAVKRADREAKIVLAGTSGIDLRFIRAVAAHTRTFDVVAVHPYRGLPEPSFLKQVKDLRRLHKPIWFSEIGWPAGEGCDTCFGEVEQARYLVRFYTLAAAAGIQRVFWYDLRDDPHSASNPEAHFGLLRRDLSAKPAFGAYAYLARLLDNSHYVGADWLGQHGLYTFRFQLGHTHISVLWNASNQTRKLTLAWPHAEANFITADGQVLAQLTPDAGHVTVTAPQGGEPFYLVDTVPAYHVPAFGALLRVALPPLPPRPHVTPPTSRSRAHPTVMLRKSARAASNMSSGRTMHPTPAPRHEHGATVPRPRASMTIVPPAPPSLPGRAP